MAHVTIHTSVSADGRVEDFAPDIGLHYDVAAAFEPDVHLAGSQTILAADMDLDGSEPQAPPRDDPSDTRPLLAVVDSRGRVRSWMALRRAPFWRDRMVALCSRTTPAEHLERLAALSVDRVVAGERTVDLDAALGALEHSYGARRVLVDSGGTLNGVLLRAGLVDELSLLVHPVLVDGSYTSVIRPDGASAAVDLRLRSVERLTGDVVWLRYDVASPSAAD